MSSALALRAYYPRPRPILKWAGGKTQLVPEILARLPQNFGRYFEPFVGGGAVFFALQPRRAFLSDVNDNLITTYKAVRDDVWAVIAELESHRANKEHYYHVRAIDPAQLAPAEAAARMIFLNRTCFNGLYRVNKSGKFNVPFGSYKNPTICNAENLMAVSDTLCGGGVHLMTGSVFETAARARRGDVVYFDPPYDPVSSTASFTSYTSGRFCRDEQRALAQLFAELAARGVHVVLSNSDTPFINELYKGFRIERVYARRAINSRGDRRGRVAEVLVTI